MVNYIIQVLIAIDQLLNTLMGGVADETISSRCYRLRHHWFWFAFGFIVDTLFLCLGQRDHCRESYIYEYIRSRRKRVHLK